MPDDEPISPNECRQYCPFVESAAGRQLRWPDLDVVRHRDPSAAEIALPPLTHHALTLFSRPPKQLEVLYAGISRVTPPPADSIIVVPAGCPTWWRWEGAVNALHVFVTPSRVARVAAEVFDLDSAHIVVPPIDGIDLPHLRAAMLAAEDELMAAAAGACLAAESLANLLAVHLIRHIATQRQPRGEDGAMPRRKLRSVLEYIEEHLAAGLTVEQMADAAHLSAYHFARQFKEVTGLPPHQYVITRRVERARELMCRGDQPLAEIAMSVGFSDQSQLTHHFKRIVGVTPGQFRKSARIT